MTDDKPIGARLFSATNLLKRRMENNVSSFGVTRMQSMILRYIEKNGTVYQRDIENLTSIRRSSVTSVLQIMEKNGLIIRTQSQIDARQKQVAMTELGQQVQNRIKDSITDIEKTLDDALTENERDTLISALDKLNKALEREENSTL